MTEEELKAYRKRYYEENKEHLRYLNLKNYYANWEKNKERNREYAKEYYRRKKEKKNENLV